MTLRFQIMNPAPEEGEVVRIVDEKLLASFRGGWCEWCRTAVAVHAHHLYSRGAGRCDVRENVVSLCAVDHANTHNGKSPTREQLLELVAAREGTTAAKIVTKIQRLRRLDKDGKEPKRKQ
jgi:hypothetical protein